MELEFKHFVYMTAILCAAWGLAVSGMVVYDDHTKDVAIKSELTSSPSIPSPFQFLDKFNAVSQTLNVVLPLGFICIAFLLYTYRTNPIGGISLLLVVGLFSYSSLSSLDAAESVLGPQTRGAENTGGLRDFQALDDATDAAIAQIVWWMPKDRGA